MNPRPLLPLILAGLAGGCATNGEPPAPPAPLPPPQVIAPQPQINGSIYQSGLDVRLYEDRIARRVGDLVTVIFEEQTSAQKDASTSANKDQGISLSAPVFGNQPATINGSELSVSASANRTFDGEGESDQSNVFEGTLTATVVAVQPNGNMVIQGQKKLTLNQGDEYVTVTGVIRREDVLPNNTISSTRVANAQIAYTGKGFIHDANSMGWLARIFYSVIWPF